MSNYAFRHFPLVFSICIRIFIKIFLIEFTIFWLYYTFYILFSHLILPLSICNIKESFDWQISGTASCLILYSALQNMVLTILYLWQLLCMYIIHPFSCIRTLRQKLNWILFTSFKMVNKVPCTYQFKKKPAVQSKYAEVIVLIL